MEKTSFFFRPAARALALCLVIAPVLAAAPAVARKAERGVESAHQPVVERTDFVFDVTGESDGTLGSADRSRLNAWFSALRLGYGDHVSLASAGGSLALRDAVGEVVGRYGLLVEGDAPVTAGEAPAGGVRVVVSRSTASVPGCPSWRDKAEADFVGGLSDNYGCAAASNLAAMVADPRDLVEGRASDIDPTNGVSGKAIKAYQEKAPTGAGGLQAMSAGGK
ncbi:CpaD family pilus assembly protein [Sphingobium lignivorans]|uniref:Pilus assembly protein CpaD n=1 Tax=Sphingobium lignivorans TaxID=2735886 RepID=A0ABR6NDP1_9SPHN|nr:CpaD family pilus assembly protein [Sphingobium lignivorans]MBB5984354.1 pilus assembly protein CpaD [Sphingobium lignivorans]